MEEIKNIVIDLEDPNVFSTLYKNNFVPLKYFGLKYINDTQQVCDLIQEIFLKLWKSHQQFENKVVCRAFLYRSLRNACLNEIRNSRIRGRIEQSLKTEESEESFLAHMIEAEVFDIIREGFERLPESVKRVYRMSLEGMSHAEIAEVLHITVNTVKKHKNTAHHLLRDRFKDLFVLISYFI